MHRHYLATDVEKHPSLLKELLEHKIALRQESDGATVVVNPHDDPLFTTLLVKHRVPTFAAAVAHLSWLLNNGRDELLRRTPEAAEVLAFVLEYVEGFHRHCDTVYDEHFDR
jgi:hypothetical protein